MEEWLPNLLELHKTTLYMTFIMRKFSIILEKYIQSGNSEMTLDRSVSSSKQWKSGYSRVDVVACIVLSASILDYSTF